jgi:hypothetical protein
MFAGLAPSVNIYLNKSSKEHTDAEPSAKGFFVVHQSSGKDFAVFIVVACLDKVEDSIMSAIFRSGRNKGQISL